MTDSPRIKVITGEWDGKQIWRWATPEETLIAQGIDPKIARIGIALLGKPVDGQNV